MTVVGTGYTYLQEFLPNVAQAAVRQGWTDFVGLGRMVLSYPELPRDVLATGAMARKKPLPHLQRLHHRAPQRHRQSGCYPLDPAYKKSPQNAALASAKKAARLA